MTDRLAGQIVLHRELARADPASVSRMVTRYPPTTRNGDGEVETEPADGVGMNLSPRLIRYLGHPEGFGESFPWRAALWSLRGECRRQHRYHRDPKWQGSLCEAAVRAVIIRQRTTREASVELDYGSVNAVLRESLTFIEDEMYARQRARSQDDADPLPDVRHVPLPGLHAIECPVCRREGAKVAQTQARTASVSAAD